MNKVIGRYFLEGERIFGRYVPNRKYKFNFIDGTNGDWSFQQGS